MPAPVTLIAPSTKNLYVDGGRTDQLVSDGSLPRPFKTIGAAISQIITNGDNSSHNYTVNIAPGVYNESLSFNSSTLYSIVFTALAGSGTALQNTIVSNSTALTSTSNNTQLATLIFNQITFNGSINLTGDSNGTNFGSSQILFSDCQFNNSSGTFVLNNVNNVSFYGGQIQGGSGVATWTNVAFAYIQGAEGVVSGYTLNLVDNPGGNVPSQYSGNYLLLSTTKMDGTCSIDAGSELDAIQSYFGSSSTITNNGTIHSFGSTWSGSLVLNSGSATRLRGDLINTTPTLNGGAVTTNQTTSYLGAALLGSSAAPAANAVLVTKDGHQKSTQTTAPTTTTNANAGSGASSSVSHATDNAGILSLTTGSASFSSGVQTTVNFNKSYNVAPIVVITPTNNNAIIDAVLRGVYVTSSISGFSINFNSADISSTTYTWNYHVIETQ